MLKGTKHDGEKSPITLVDPEYIRLTADVLAFGAKKYAKHNWRGGIEVSRLLDAAMRHILAVADGQDTDPESNLRHLGHASCCLMMANWMLTHRPDLDDRAPPPPTLVTVAAGVPK